MGMREGGGREKKGVRAARGKGGARRRSRGRETKGLRGGRGKGSEGRREGK